MKFLPKILISGLLTVQLLLVVPSVYALTPTPDLTPAVTQTPAPTTPLPTDVPTGATITPPPGSVPEGQWVPNANVTFVGKTAARATAFLDWTLQNYNWLSIPGNATNPLTPFWIIMRNIVYAFFMLFVLVTAFILIITRGRNMTIPRFIPRFIGIVLLVSFSFSLVQFIYQIADIVQGFFLRFPGQLISSKDLISLGLDYTNFIGLQLSGAAYEESASITLLLTKLTAMTYYVMSGMLLLRKIILWFFVVISPVFPLLLLYNPIRNTAKVWFGEFLRWLLYGPLFSIFLAGLVSVWQRGIPLPFNFNAVGDEAKIVYPTAVNILLSGPGTASSITNSLNLPDTFALYVVALIMLWVTIILPFLLLQMFLDYFMSFSASENGLLKQLASRGSLLFNRPATPLAPTPPLGPKPGTTGLARALPIANKFNVSSATGTSASRATAQTTATQTATQTATISARPVQTQANTDMLKLTNLSMPTMRDIVRFETARLSKDMGQHQEVIQVRESLERIANPSSVSAPAERQQYQMVQSRLVQESQKGNVMASSILRAAEVVAGTSVAAKNKDVASVHRVLTRIANPSSVSAPEEREKYQQIHDALVDEKQKGNQFASRVLSATKVVPTEEEVKKLRQELTAEKNKNSQLATQLVAVITQAEQEEAQRSKTALPTANRIQAVSLDDYEAVKKMWQENYQNLDVPKSLGNTTKGRATWLQEDISDITNAINLLSSSDPAKIDEGMQAVSGILPFLLMGGFSQDEIIAYLKAKQEAAKSVLEEVKTKGEDEETMIDAQQQTTVAQKYQTTAVAINTETKNVTNNNTTTVSTESPIVGQVPTVIVKSDIVSQVTNLTLPTIKDIVQYEVARISGNTQQRDEIGKIQQTLEKIGNPTVLVNLNEKQQYETMRSSLVQEGQQGNYKALSFLAAAQAATTKKPSLAMISRVRGGSVQDIFKGFVNPPANLPPAQKAKLNGLQEQLTQESSKGNQLATKVIQAGKTGMSDVEEQKLLEELQQAKAKNDVLATTLVTVITQSQLDSAIPAANNVQQVSLEDYEAVKKIWQENYQTLDVPAGKTDRAVWVKGEVDEVTNTINLIVSKNPADIEQGMERLSQILPFLLMGGFSQSEIVSYLKAKQEAGRAVLTEITKKEDDEETKVDRQQVPVPITKEASVQQASPLENPVDVADGTWQ